ncbi:unnamed protein product [Haemonchus placei]|uniref:Uncharacterized protein n=1 Tax=Haemonchus placei TaxID=6290 RepID=A0A0N4WPA3_HAEPC|nr:unnamed protein product [Haemonchus placei]
MCVALILLANAFYKVYYWLFDLCEHAFVSALLLATVFFFFLPVLFNLESVRAITYNKSSQIDSSMYSRLLSGLIISCYSYTFSSTTDLHEINIRPTTAVQRRVQLLSSHLNDFPFSRCTWRKFRTEWNVEWLFKRFLNGTKSRT